MSRRTQRTEDLLRAELADLLLRETRDPRLQAVHISSVEVSADLGHARVLVSVLANEAERTEVLEALERAAGFFRSALARRLKHMRRTPSLAFDIDRGAEHSQRIQELLENAECAQFHRPTPFYKRYATANASSSPATGAPTVTPSARPWAWPGS